MAQISKGGADYIGYEYKEKQVPISLSSLYLDSYPCFGWEEDPNANNRDAKIKNTKYVLLHFRRDRKICNKTELTRLQRSFDGCVAEIEALEQSKTTYAVMWSITVGLIGTAFMAGAVFAAAAEPPKWWLMVILAIPGFVGWISAYFVYCFFLHRQTMKAAAIIEQKYDQLYEICEKGNSILIK